jgi:citrate lyase beta subunit
MLRKRRPHHGSLTADDLGPVLVRLRRVNAAVTRAYPGESATRQPVHTVYGGAHLFKADTARKLGDAALAFLDEYAPDPQGLASALQFDRGDGALVRLAPAIRERVADKLRREPVEDFRIDFEDGYGHRPDDEEDGHSAAAAEEVAKGMVDGTLPPFIGIRIKPVSKELHARSLRTLDLFLTTLVSRTKRELRTGFVVTVPKVMSGGQVMAVAGACAALERKLKLRPGLVRLELMIETPQAIIGPDGACALRTLVASGMGRVRSAHFGTYDYTALCGITASHQQMGHPACEFAKHMMQVSLAQTGVQLSDGATNVLPVPPHRPSPDRPLTVEQRQQNRDTVHRAWQLHFNDVSRSLMQGFYQGWDLHPAQLPTRFAAVAAFFLSARADATARLRNFVDRAAQATLIGDVFDDAATGQGLLNFFVRGLSAGALTIDEARETGLTTEELQGRSFVKILENRRRGAVPGS